MSDHRSVSDPVGHLRCESLEQRLTFDIRLCDSVNVGCANGPLRVDARGPLVECASVLTQVHESDLKDPIVAGGESCCLHIEDDVARGT